MRHLSSVRSRQRPNAYFSEHGSKTIRQFVGGRTIGLKACGCECALAEVGTKHNDTTHLYATCIICTVGVAAVCVHMKSKAK